MTSPSSNNTGCLSLFATFAIFITWWIVAAHISDTRATRTAETYGFTDVEVSKDSSIWFIWFKGCSPDDMKVWRVTGTNPRGERRSFVVCAGLSGNTIRVR